MVGCLDLITTEYGTLRTASETAHATVYLVRSLKDYGYIVHHWLSIVRPSLTMHINILLHYISVIACTVIATIGKLSSEVLG